MWAFILQAINTLHDKEFGHTRLYSLYASTAKDHEYCANLQTNILSITGVYTLMYTCKVCVKCHSCEFLIIIVNF